MVGRAHRVGAGFRAVVALPALGAVLLTAACGSNGAPPAPAGTGAAAGVSIGPESVVTVTAGEIRTGPLLSGELRAARDFQVARARLALLPDLPLASTASSAATAAGDVSASGATASAMASR